MSRSSSAHGGVDLQLGDVDEEPLLGSGNACPWSCSVGRARRGNAVQPLQLGRVWTQAERLADFSAYPAAAPRWMRLLRIVHAKRTRVPTMPPYATEAGKETRRRGSAADLGRRSEGRSPKRSITGGRELSTRTSAIRASRAARDDLARAGVGQGRARDSPSLDSTSRWNRCIMSAKVS